MSMAAGEYGSVSSQRDTELADIARETRELARFPEHELEELTQIYEERGLDRRARRRGRDAAHATRIRSAATCATSSGSIRDTMARPVQAAVVSAASFAVGAALALLTAALAPASARIAVIAVVTLVLLAVLGRRRRPARRRATACAAALRITVGGGLAMAATAVIGALVGTVT